MDQVFQNAVDQVRSYLSHLGLFRELVSLEDARSRCGGHVGQDWYCDRVRNMSQQGMAGRDMLV
jgi:hypothetical protein